jgi:beta-glucosidase
MVPLDVNFIDYLENAVTSGAIPESRIDESVRRILELKKTLGMFDAPVPR